jgi:cytochrome c biogenesis factor
MKVTTWNIEWLDHSWGVIEGRYEPGKNFYPVEQQVSNEPAIRSDRWTLEDLFLILDRTNPDGSVQLKALAKPLVNLIWIAGFVFLAGALIALWPDPVEQRRLQERYALQLA